MGAGRDGCNGRRRRRRDGAGQDGILGDKTGAEKAVRAKNPMEKPPNDVLLITISDRHTVEKVYTSPLSLSLPCDTHPSKKTLLPLQDSSLTL